MEEWPHPHRHHPRPRRLWYPPRRHLRACAKRIRRMRRAWRKVSTRRRAAGGRARSSSVDPNDSPTARRAGSLDRDSLAEAPPARLFALLTIAPLSCALPLSEAPCPDARATCVPHPHQREQPVAPTLVLGQAAMRIIAALLHPRRTEEPSQLESAALRHPRLANWWQKQNAEPKFPFDSARLDSDPIGN